MEAEEILQEECKTKKPPKVAVIGQAFPYTPIANPKRFIPDWTFGIRDEDMQAIVDDVRANEKPDVVVVISHNGMDVDLKMASIITGVDVIFGGHTHDGVPGAIKVKNAGGETLVTNAGSNGKFLGVMDLDVRNGKVQDYRFRLLPVFSNLLPADAEMAAYIEQVRAPYKDQLNEELAVAEDVMYRRGNFNGTFDQLICDALIDVKGAQISSSPGFRWGVSVLPGVVFVQVAGYVGPLGGLIVPASESAYACDSSRPIGMSTKSGSPR